MTDAFQRSQRLTISWIFENIHIFEHLCDFCITGGRGRGSVVGGKLETSGAGNRVEKSLVLEIPARENCTLARSLNHQMDFWMHLLRRQR